MTNQSLRSLADIATATYYTMPTLSDLDAYFRAELMISPDDTIDSPAALIDALDRDINDLIHNSNIADLLPFADELDNDSFDALADRIDDTRFTALIARRILLRLTDDMNE